VTDHRYPFKVSSVLLLSTSLTWFLESLALNIQVIITLSQCLLETFYCHQVKDNCYDSRLSIKLGNKPYIRLIQENSIEFLLQTSLSYIP